MLKQLFFQGQLTHRSRILAAGAGVAMLAAIFLPLWQMTMISNQYPEGLRMWIYSYKLTGDLQEINTLNHYIGMKPLARADFAEMTWLPFAFGAFALLALRAAAIGRMASLVDLGVLFLYFGAFSLGNFYYRLYSYGHTLDPKAPMTINPFTPIMIGSQKIANFVQTSLPQSGALFLALFPALIGAAMWFSRREEP